MFELNSVSTTQCEAGEDDDEECECMEEFEWKKDKDLERIHGKEVMVQR